MTTEKIFTSIYQDVYRLHYGVVFIVNKFTSIKYSLKDYSTKQYYGTEYLRMLTEPAVNHLTGDKYDVGTVLYEYCPVRLAEKNQWTYELKIGRGCCYGSAKDMRKLMREMEKIISGRI